MSVRSKYRALPTVVDGIRFASKREAKRYGELMVLKNAGRITALKLQPSFVCSIGPHKICTYRADFEYICKLGQRVIEDCKGFRTPVYKIKKKLVEALYGIKILET